MFIFLSTSCFAAKYLSVFNENLDHRCSLICLKKGVKVAVNAVVGFRTDNVRTNVTFLIKNY